MLAGRAAPKKRASATGQRFGDCFDERVVQRGYALTLRTCRDDDAKSAFASCGHAAALALGSNVPTCGCEQSQQATGTIASLAKPMIMLSHSIVIRRTASTLPPQKIEARKAAFPLRTATA
jgi:hypothetical protein